MPIVTIGDTETTGFSAAKGHRFVEVCFGMYDLETRRELRMFNVLINPLRDIPADASRVHGIFLEDLHNAPTWDKVAPLVNGVLNKSDVFVAHNTGFDAPFIGEELMRVGITPKDIPLFCTMENGRWATANGKNPKLQELCWALDVDYDPAKAHRASYDVSRTAECLWKGIDLGYFKLPVQGVH